MHFCSQEGRFESFATKEGGTVWWTNGCFWFPNWQYIPLIYIYILPSGGLYATYHPLREPETTIDWWTDFPLVANASWYRKVLKLIDTFSTTKTAMEVIEGESNVLVEVLRQKPSKVQSF